MKKAYRPFDQEEHLGSPPWSKYAVEIWEAHHGHDVRTKCYVEYGCKAIEEEFDRALGEVHEFLLRIAENCHPLGDPTELIDISDDAKSLLKRGKNRKWWYE